MICSIHQPNYIPYIGIFYKMSRSDVFCYLDDAQFSNNGMHNYNSILTSNGVCRLKATVEYRFGDSINKVRTKNDSKWKENHLKTLRMNYAKAPYFHEVFPKFESLLMQDYPSLASMNEEISTWIASEFGFRTMFVRSSDLSINTLREERVIDICKAVGADVYYSGHGAKSYQDEKDFEKEGISLVYTDYVPVKYHQMWGKEEENLSVLDYVFNMGFDWEYIKRYERTINGWSQF